MRLDSFRVKNFRSIDDSGECVLASDVTILAGKNEAGKTNLLQALGKFNQDKKFEEVDKPLEGDDGPEVTLKFSTSEEEMTEWATKLEIPSTVNLPKITKIPIVITKKSDNSYVFEGPNGSLTGFIENEKSKLGEVTKERDEAIVKLKDFISQKGLLITSIIEGKEISSASIANVMTEIETAFPTISPEEQTEIKVILDMVKSKLGESDQLLGVEAKRRKEFLDSLPKFVLFDSFDQEELLPYQIALTKATENRAVNNYCSIVGLDIKKVIETKDPQFRIKMVNEKSAIIQGNFGEYWKQDEIDLTMSSYGDDLIFGIKEKGKSYDFKIEQRSKGLQWFLSFYLLLKARADKLQTIVLVDEPGLYVHAKAQEDILRILTDQSAENQIIFSSHSPYLIDPARLDRIRLVIKNLVKKVDKEEKVENGSRVYELSSMPTADKDTLTPIITAIGLDISRQLTFAAEKNVVLEGISDYNFLKGLMETLPQTEKTKVKDLHLIPCKGADNIPMVVSFLIGWGLGYKVLLDNDEKGKEVSNVLIEKLQVDEGQVVFVSGTDNYCVEDIFAKNDFNKYVLEKPENYRVGELNSQVIAVGKKAVLSREFLNKVRKGKVHLTTETKKNFRDRLTAISTF